MIVINIYRITEQFCIQLSDNCVLFVQKVVIIAVFA